MLAATTAALKEPDHSLIVQCDSAEVYNSDFNQGNRVITLVQIMI